MGENPHNPAGRGLGEIPRLELEGLAFRERARADAAEARLAEAEKALAHRHQELVVQSKAADRWCREAEEYRDRLVEVEQALQRAHDAIRDIDAHATPYGEDEDGFVSGGYLISVGSLHRALALTGAAAKCADVPCGRASHIGEALRLVLDHSSPHFGFSWVHDNARAVLDKGKQTDG